MPNYYVTVREVHTQGYRIAAPDPETARRIAAEEGDPDEGSFAYSHTLPEEHTTVEEITEEITE